MKKYYNQIFNEGLGACIYKPISTIINKKTNKKIVYLFWKINYIIIVIMVAILIFWLTFPLK